MNMALHIFAKDARRLTWQLVLWFVILVAALVVAVVWNGQSPAQPLLSGLLAGYGAYLAAAVVKLDSPANPLADWRSRPLTPGQVLSAKFLTVAVLVASAALMHGIALVDSGIPSRLLLPAILEGGMPFLAIVCGAAAIAASMRTLGAAVALFAGVILLLQLADLILLAALPRRMATLALWEFGMTYRWAALLAASMAVLSVAYLDGRQRQIWVLFGAGLVIAAAIRGLPVMTYLSDTQGRLLAGTAELSVTLASNADQRSLRWTGNCQPTTGHRYWMAPVEVDGVNPGWSLVEGTVSGKLSFAGGDSHRHDSCLSLSAASRKGQRSMTTSGNSVAVLDLAELPADIAYDPEAVYAGSVLFDAERQDFERAMPLRQGESLEIGNQQLEIAAVDPSGDGVSITLISNGYDLRSRRRDRPMLSFSLRSRDSGDVVTQKSSSGGESRWQLLLPEPRIWNGETQLDFKWKNSVAGRQEMDALELIVTSRSRYGAVALDFRLQGMDFEQMARFRRSGAGTNANAR